MGRGREGDSNTSAGVSAPRPIYGDVPPPAAARIVDLDLLLYTHRGRGRELARVAGLWLVRAQRACGGGGPAWQVARVVQLRRFGGPPGEAKGEGCGATVVLYDLRRDGGGRGGGGVCG